MTHCVLLVCHYDPCVLSLPLVYHYDPFVLLVCHYDPLCVVITPSMSL